MKYLKLTITIAALGFILTSCERDLDPAEQFSSGTLNLSNYVAVGNSLTAGYQDADVYDKGQANSYPAIMAQSFASVGGGTFTQPTIGPGGLGKRLVLGALTNCKNEPGLAPVPAGLPPDGSTLTGPFNNMGVPGAKSFHLGLAGYGALNPYFGRMQSGPTTSVIADAAVQLPTFFTMWIGNNDVLSYATTGGIGMDQTGNFNPATYGGNDISDPNVVAGAINQYLQALTTGGAKGALANIPNVTDIPFFTTVPGNLIVLDAASAAGLTGFWQVYAGLLAQNPAIGASAAQYAFTFNEGPNYPIIKVAPSTGNPMGLRQMAAGELLPLTINTDAIRCQGYGTAAITPAVQAVLVKVAGGQTPTPAEIALVLGAPNPLEDKDVLEASELQSIANATVSYNGAIAGLAQTYDLALVDANAEFAKIKADGGILFGGANYSTTFVTGGLFSLDGVHPTQKGYAVVANLFIDAINAHYGSSIPKVDINEYPGVALP